MSEDIMRQWDSWRKYIADGGGASWPRDAFESIIDGFEEDISDLRAEVENWRANARCAGEQVDMLAADCERFRKALQEIVDSRWVSDPLKDIARAALNAPGND